MSLLNIDPVSAVRSPRPGRATMDAVAEEAPRLRTVEGAPSYREPSISPRRMPESISKYLIRMQGGKEYLPAAYRLVWFRDECPDWGISTQLLEGGHEPGFATVQAMVINPEGRIIASGIKTETKTDFPAGWVEKAETGAISRALAVAGFGTQFSPELDDQNSAGDRAGLRAPRTARSAPAPASDAWEGPGLCPHCHAPAGRRHGKPCVAV